jgi:riboflavin synthase
MFTGLIAELGSITAIDKGADSAVFKIDAPGLISEINLGDSVAVNGVCLTATSVSGTEFTADVMIQTLSLTSLAKTIAGNPVNLELAAQLNARMGGHMVQGHVDGVATVIGYIVNQGSICLDGVSLTVGQIDDATSVVTVWLIPETLERTNLSSKKPGDLVNVEVDVLAKYVERLLAKGDK